MRRIGWFFAGAFVIDGLWEILFSARQFLLAHVMIASTFVCLAVAYLYLAREARRRALSVTESWLVTLPLGLFFGWVTAATFVGFATTFVALGLLGGGAGEALVGVALLLLGGLLASVVILYAKAAPGPEFYLPYATAISWALAAVIVNQYDDSILTTGTALFAGALVVAALLGALRGGPLGKDASRLAKPGAA